MKIPVSILMGSAAALVGVGAQAADLPTKKAAPAADYVKICDVNGVAGFIIPGSDTCLKLGGTVIGRYAVGNLKTTYTLTGAGDKYAKIDNRATNDSFSMGARAYLNLDTAMNTSYGALVSSFQFRARTSSGDGSGIGYVASNTFVTDHAYIRWAGITAGLLGASYFNTLPNGAFPIKDFYESDVGPLVLAYTASFGGGFSGTVSLENTDFFRFNSTYTGIVSNTYHGIQYPDVVANLDLKQGWGEATVSGVAHNSNITLGSKGGSSNTWGYGVNAGVVFNLPQLGAGDTFGLQGQVSKGALGYSGVSANSPVLQNGNGTKIVLLDRYEYAPGLWTSPTAWNIGTYVKHYFSPQFWVAPEVSYLSINYGSGPTNISNKITSWKGGAVVAWVPVSKLTFSVEALYTSTNESKPANWVANPAQSFVSKSDGFYSGLQIRRDF